MGNALGARLSAPLARVLCYAALVLMLLAAGCGNCGPSVAMLGDQAPNGPGGVRLTGNAASQSVLVEWNAVPGADSYEIYWMDSPNGTPQLIGTTSDLFYVHTNVSSGVGYYQVAARNPNGLSGLTVPMPCDCHPEDPNPGPPVVISNTPANGATGVGTESTIGAGFSEPIEPESVTSATFVVEGPSGPVAGDLSAGGSAVTFNPDFDLTPGTTYTVTITTGVTDLSGENLVNNFTWSFTTAEPGQTDVTPPAVFSTTPVNGATNVSVNTTVGVVFTELMNIATINLGSFTVTHNGSPLGGSLTKGGATAVFVPGAPLLPSTTYAGTVTTSCTDLSGNAIVTNYIWSFTTASDGSEQADNTPPTVIANTPLHEATGVSVNTNVGVTFSEAMDASTLTTSSFIVQTGGVNVPGAVTASGTGATFTPANPLHHNTVYTVFIMTTAADLAGNHLQNLHAFSFTTANSGTSDITPPTVIFNSPSNGATDVPVTSPVLAGFSEVMSPATINTTSFLLSTGGNPVSGSVTYSDTTAVFTPHAPLQPGTVYSAAVTTLASDLSGNNLVAQHIWSFTTAAAVDPDITAPFVITGTPADNSTNVPVASTIDVVFSEAMDPATVGSASFTVAAGGLAVSGSVTGSGANATFTPDAPLAHNTLYTAKIHTSATDLAGNNLLAEYVWTFTTAGLTDSDPPLVTSTNPADGASGVAVSTPISVSFNEAMDPQSLTSLTYFITLGGAPIAGTISYDNGAATATFTPASPLQHGAPYTGTVTQGATDTSGNPLATLYSWSFTTGSAPDTTAPTVIENDPANGATSVAISSSITVKFSEIMAAASLNSGSFLVTLGGSPVDGSLSAGGDTLVFTPASPLQYSSTYSVTVTTAATDLAGNPLASQHSFSFTTGNAPDTTAPEVVSVTPLNGSTAVALDSNLSAVFNEPMDPASISSASFTLQAGGVFLLGSVSYNELGARFVPSQPLAYSTTYTATITTGAADVTGNPLAAPYTWSFTTPAAPDTTAPTVISTVPAGGATGVPVNAVPAITFSEPMAPSTLNTATVIMTGGGPPLPGTVSYSGTTATFIPASPLNYNTTYTVTVKLSATDLAGNNLSSGHSFSFTTLLPPDTTAPTVVSQTPAPNATNVAVGTGVNVGFSEAMDPATINNSTVSVTTGGASVIGTVGYSGTTAVFTPGSPLSYGTTYTVTVTTGARDLGGNALGGNVSWTFTTGNAPDTTAPTITSRTPAPNATGVSTGANLTVVFSEPMDPATMTSSKIYIKKGETILSGTVTYSGTTAVFTPSSPLLPNTTYTGKVWNDVKDLAGNPLGVHTTWTFKTGAAPDTVGPHITGKSPAPNATNIATNAPVKITFNEAVDPATLTSSTFKVKKGSTTIMGTISVNGNVATFTPLGGFDSSKTYTVYVTTGVKDLAGNALTESCTYNFKTGNWCY